jgi:hypothetical protein
MNSCLTWVNVLRALEHIVRNWSWNKRKTKGDGGDHQGACTKLRFQNCAMRETNSMHDRSVWENVSTAPFDCDLELAVIEGDILHALDLPVVVPWMAGSKHKRGSVLS